MWDNYSKIEGFDQDWNYQGYERNIQDFFDFEGVFFFLLGILGGVLAVVLGLVLIQQGRICVEWLIRTRRQLSRPPSYNTVTKPPRYSICGGWTPNSPTSIYSNQTDGTFRSRSFPDPPSYSQVFTVETRRNGPILASTEVYVDEEMGSNTMVEINDNSVSAVDYQSSSIQEASREMSIKKWRLSSCKSLFTFDNSRSRIISNVSQKSFRFEVINYS